MKIPSASTLFQSLTVTTTSGEKPNWQPGQTLQATVLSNLENGLVKLRIGATILTAQFEASVKAGDKLTLEVISLGNKPLLHSVRNDSVQALVEAAIRQTLPRQQSLAQLLSHIEAFIQQKQLPSLPDNVQNALKNLYQSFPDRQSVSQAIGVKQAFSQSGLFLEARLSGQQSTTPVNINIDIKAGLLRLQQALQQHLSAPQNTGSTQTSLATSNTYSPASIRAGSDLPGPASNEVRPGIATNPALSVNRNTIPVVTLSPEKSAVTITPAQTTPTPASIPTPAPASAPASTLAPVAVNAELAAKVTQDRSAPAATAQSTPVTQTAAVKPEGLSSANAVNSQNTTSTLTHSQRLMAGLSLPTSTQFGVTSPMQSTINNSPYILPAHIAFRLNIESAENRPSARFSRLDNLTKILTLFLKDADSSLARIQLNQLSQHQIEPEQKQAWLFEIPVRHKESIDLFKFRIEKDQAKNQQSTDEENTGWTVHINFNIEALGQVQCKVNIHQQQVSIIFWTAQQETTTAFQQHLQTLQHELEDAGLVVNHLNCILGQPPEHQNAFTNKGVLDEQA